MTEMFGEAWSPMSVPDLAPDDDDDEWLRLRWRRILTLKIVSFEGNELSYSFEEIKMKNSHA